MTAQYDFDAVRNAPIINFTEIDSVDKKKSKVMMNMYILNAVHAVNWYIIYNIYKYSFSVESNNSMSAVDKELDELEAVLRIFEQKLESLDPSLYAAGQTAPTSIPAPPPVPGPPTPMPTTTPTTPQGIPQPPLPVPLPAQGAATVNSAPQALQTPPPVGEPEPDEPPVDEKQLRKDEILDDPDLKKLVNMLKFRIPVNNVRSKANELGQDPGAVDVFIYIYIYIIRKLSSYGDSLNKYYTKLYNYCV